MSSRTVAVGLVTFSVFTDILAYSIAVPVLPDLSQRFGASPTLIGLLFASFGVTLLAVSVPMGAISDRIGRRLPLLGGLLALLFTYPDKMYTDRYYEPLWAAAQDATAMTVGALVVGGRWLWTGA